MSKKITNKSAVLAFLLSLCMLASVFIGCGNESSSGNGTETTANAEKGNESTAEESAGIPVTEYTIIRSDSSDNFVLRQVLNIRAAIEKKYKVSISSSTDWNGNENNSESKEILLGITNRPESIAVNAELENAFGYIIKNVDEKIVIAASTERLLEQAVNVFIDDCLAHCKDQQLPKNLNVKYTEDVAVFFDDETLLLGLQIPADASPALESAVEIFAKGVRQLFGTEVEIGRTEGADGKVVLSVFSTDASQSTEEEQLFINGFAYTAAEERAEGFEIGYRKGYFEMRADSDLGMVGALSQAMEYLSAHREITSDGHKSVCCENDLEYKGMLTGKAPRMINGTFLDTESITSRCNVHYYEDVTPEEMEDYCKMITEGFQYIFISADAYGRLQYYSEDRSVKLMLSYRKDSEYFSVIEELV